MKHTVRLSAVLMTIICIFTSCNNKNNSEKSDTVQIPEYKTFRTAYSDQMNSMTVSMEFPVSGEKQYLDSVRSWICDVLSLNPFTEDNKLPDYTENKDDANSLLEYYSKHKWKEFTFYSDGLSDKDIQVEVENQDSIFVTFKNYFLTSISFVSYWYLGGAHGTTAINCATFNNKTGKTYGWEIVGDKTQLMQYITEGLIEYFEVSTEEEMKDILLVNNTAIPLPQQCPYFIEDGLVLQYQQYEIAPYSAGMPHILIPWDKCSEVLTPEFTALLQQNTSK